jgi:hypothetical protein
MFFFYFPFQVPPGFPLSMYTQLIMMSDVVTDITQRLRKMERDMLQLVALKGVLSAARKS